MTLNSQSTPQRLPAPVLVDLPGIGRSVVLDVLRNGPLPRSEIARRLAVNPGHLTRVVQALADAGLVRETTVLGPPQLGRPSRPLAVVPEACHTIGVKVTPHSIHAVVCDLAAHIVDERTHQYSNQDPAEALAAVARAYRDLAHWHPLAIGVTLGGQVHEGWSVRVAPTTGWRDVPFGSMVEQATGLSTIVTNDIIALTTAEHWYGTGRGISNFAILTIGAGVGFGLVSNDMIVQNSDTGLGLIGHETVSELGGMCPLGHHGCAMSALTFDGLAATVSTALGRELSFSECLRLAQESNPVASAAVADAGRALGRLVASIATLAMPDKIVIAGEGIELAEQTWPQILEVVALRRPPEAKNLDVELVRIAESEWARGAAVTAIEWCISPETSSGSASSRSRVES